LATGLHLDKDYLEPKTSPLAQNSLKERSPVVFLIILLTLQATFSGTEPFQLRSREAS